MHHRGFLKCFIFSILLSMAIICSVSAQDPIKIGYVNVLSGPMRTSGEVTFQGVELAVNEINVAGGILGRRVVIVKADDQLKPDIGKQAVRDLVINEQVDIVIGMTSSAVAKAVTPMMNELRSPLIITQAMADEVTGSLCNPWTFRIAWNLEQCLNATVLLARELGATTWTSVGPDYGHGQDCWKIFTKRLGKLGSYQFKEPVYTPTSTTDWKPVIKKLVESGADGVMVSLWGKNLQDFIQQGNEIGFFEGRKAICPIGGTVAIFVTLGFLHMPKGIWLGASYWFEAHDNPANQKFVDLYKSLSQSQIPPSFSAYNGYAAVKMFKAAVEKARTSDREAVAKALSGLTVKDLPGGPITFRAEDHQAVYDVTLGMTSARPAKGTKVIRGLDPIRLFPGTQVTPPASEGECKMRVRQPIPEPVTPEKPKSGPEEAK